MGILANIFGSGDVIKNGMALADAMHTSDEERIKAKTDLVKAFEPFKLAQRVLAFAFTAVFLFTFLLALVMLFFNQSSVEDIIALTVAFYLPHIEITIVAFYFGGGFAEGIISRAKKK